MIEKGEVGYTACEDAMESNFCRECYERLKDEE
jgi:hypothetical protein